MHTEETQADIEYRLAEQEFVRNISNTLVEMVPDGKRPSFCEYITSGLSGILSGNRRITTLDTDRIKSLGGMVQGGSIQKLNLNQVKTLPLVNEPLDKEQAAIVRRMWRHLIHETVAFCTKETEAIDETHFKYVLRGIFLNLVTEVVHPVAQARQNQNYHRAI